MGDLEKQIASAAPGEMKSLPTDPEPNPAQPPTPSSGPDNSPEGRREAWLTVLGSFCCNFSSFGWASSIGVFQAYYAQNQLAQYGSAAISWIPSTNLFMMLVLAPFVGKAFDSYGPRPVLIVGSVAHVLGLMFLSLSTEYYQIFLSQSVLSGMGACAVCYASNNAVSTHFSRNRAFALGVAVSGSSVGGALIPIIFNRILATGMSFAWTIRILMFIFLALLSLACITCSSRIVHTPKQVSLWEFVRPFTELPFLLVTTAAFCIFWGIYIPNNFIILYAEAVGLSKELAGYQLTILNAMSMLGRIISGIFADKYGRFNTMILNLGFVVAFVLGVWIGHSSASTIAFSVCFGFGSGCFISLLPAVIAQISDIKEIGVKSGLVYFVAGFASLTGNPIGGSLVRSNGTNYVGLQVFCGVAIAVGTFIFVLARITQVKSLFSQV